MVAKGTGTRGERVAISYKMPPNIYEKVNKLVYEDKKFSTVSDCITQALIYFVDNHNGMGQFPELFREYISSDEGKDLMKKMMREVLLEVVSSQEKPQKDNKSNS
ncbi:MAG: ribbon-helix-helix domain-containing protein [Methanomicrobiales archaeon]|nr:ribbon-helix-helix domain-containing protein [Methanomicrobiales archaeon]